MKWFGSLQDAVARIARNSFPGGRLEERIVHAHALQHPAFDREDPPTNASLFNAISRRP
jgi:hypothetical protein